ncbi:MAG: dinitrogenase iron-molybdenum cofactor biosynthesis domain-containing protein [Desulfobacterales bacterium]|nr:dinitrogenase iron-molybdenum cofactor biosynthesis domain-containing protein [Desulfobacterales bacterium]MBU8909927.1 dinitrogenase iron-molybdenum cofactor biosynthesis domain-containing protein [Desulfobacterales bacterium]
MKVAVTVWDERISPVFDSARTLLIVDIKNDKMKNISYKSFNPELEASLAEELSLLGIKVLICGAISQAYSTLIEAGTIQLIPFISGNVNEVLESYIKGNPLVPAFLMPGCREEEENP